MAEPGIDKWRMSGGKGGVEQVGEDFAEKLEEKTRVAKLMARLELMPERIVVDGADAPNPERVYIQGAIDTGLTPEEYRNLTEQGGEDIRALVKQFGLKGVKEMVKLDEVIQEGEREWKKKGE